MASSGPKQLVLLKSPGSAAPADGMFDDLDDLDDLDYAYGDTAVAAPTPRQGPVAAAELQGWDAEFAPAPPATGPTKSPGVDPLLMRLGVVALVAALLVPALLSFRGSSTEALIESSSLSGPTATSNLLPTDTATAEVDRRAATAECRHWLPPVSLIRTICRLPFQSTCSRQR